ncbi:MAG: GPR endopeptidase [Bacillota bacterium]
MDKNKYTDLAVEAHDIAVERQGKIEGVNVDESRTDNTLVTRIEVLNERAAKTLGKPVGNYVTIESDGLKGQNRLVHDEITEILGRELENIINFNRLTQMSRREPVTFVAGLGNWNATPDALGPQVINNLMVTRHLYKDAPPELRDGMRSVCALSPGVLGLTGIETAEIIKGVVEKVNPDLIIVIDSLAARDTNRLGKTVQISNTGIYPGSGVGKNRLGINQNTMNKPVIALGVPTVIDAGTIVDDAIDTLMQGELFSKTERERFRHIDQNRRYNAVKNLLSNDIGRLIVSPKGVDELIRDVSRIIAGGINVALHPDITAENLSLYL